MPRAQPKTAATEPKRVQRARNRIARYTEAGRQAATAAEAHHTAGMWLMAAVKKHRAPERAARRLAAWLAPDVRTLVDRLELPEKRQRAYLTQLDQTREPRPQLGQTLALLRAVIREHDDDASHRHYAQLLASEASRLDTEHLQRGR